MDKLFVKQQQYQKQSLIKRRPHQKGLVNLVTGAKLALTHPNQTYSDILKSDITLILTFWTGENGT